MQYKSTWYELNDWKLMGEFKDPKFRYVLVKLAENKIGSKGVKLLTKFYMPKL